MSTKLKDFMALGGVGDLYANLLKHVFGMDAGTISKIMMAYVLAELSVHYADHDLATLEDAIRAEIRDLLISTKMYKPEDVTDSMIELIATSVGSLVQARQATLQAPVV